VCDVASLSIGRFGTFINWVRLTNNKLVWPLYIVSIQSKAETTFGMTGSGCSRLFWFLVGLASAPSRYQQHAHLASLMNGHREEDAHLCRRSSIQVRRCEIECSTFVLWWWIRRQFPNNPSGSSPVITPTTLILVPYYRHSLNKWTPLVHRPCRCSCPRNLQAQTLLCDPTEENCRLFGRILRGYWGHGERVGSLWLVGHSKRLYWSQNICSRLGTRR